MPEKERMLLLHALPKNEGEEMKKALKKCIKVRDEDYYDKVPIDPALPILWSVGPWLQPV